MNRRKTALRLFAVAAVGSFAVWLMVISAIQRSIRFPRHSTQADPRAGAGYPGLEKLWIESPQGPVESWFLAGKGRSPTQPGPTVLFAHGNAELIDDWPGMLDEYRAMGVNLALLEYRGYGRSQGEPSEKAITRDFIRFHDQIASRSDVDSRRIFFHGRSLGGGALCALSNHRKPAALILQSTFLSVTALARRFLLPGFLIAT